MRRWGQERWCPPQTPRYLFSSTCKNLAQVEPRERQVSVSPSTRTRAPAPSPAGDRLPAALAAAPRCGAAARGGRAPGGLRAGAKVQSRGRAGPSPSYLLSRQAIHSAEEEEWAVCAATMVGSGVRAPRPRRPPALAAPPPRQQRRPAPHRPLATRAAATGPPSALPAGSRGLPGGGPATRGPGESRAARRAALRRPRVGSPAARPLRGGS